MTTHFARARLWGGIVLTVAGFALCGANLSAAAPTRLLTLEQAIAQAIADNGNLKAARSAIVAARGRLRQSGLWPNPRLKFSGETDAAFANAGEYVGALELEQDFPIAGRLSHQEDIARVDVALALAELNEAERRLIADVATGYFAIAIADRQITLRDRLIAIASPLATASQRRYHEGEVSILDVNTASMELERLRQEQSALQGERAALSARLAALLGVSAQSPFAISPELPQIKPLPTVTDLLEVGLHHRPDLRLLALSADKAAAERMLASASAWQDLTLSLGVQKSRTVIEGLAPLGAEKALLLSLSVPLPFFNRIQGDTEAATANVSSARLKLQALQVTIEHEISGLHEQATRLAAAVSGFNATILPLSEKNIDQASIAYRKGQIGIAEVILVQRQSLEMNNGYETLLAQYYATLAALDTASFAWADRATRTVDAAPNEGEIAQ